MMEARLDAPAATPLRLVAGAAGSGRRCLECDAPLERSPGQHVEAQFCCTPCRKRWNNRRMERGAQLYDLFMAHRFQRGEAAEAGALRAMNRLASKWRLEDLTQRGGRRSWRRLNDVLGAMPWLNATVLVGRARAGLLKLVEKR